MDQWVGGRLEWAVRCRAGGGADGEEQLQRAGVRHQVFVSQAAFDVERALYIQGNGAEANPLAQFLPQVRTCVCALAFF